MGRPIRHGYMQKLVELECAAKRKSLVVPPVGGTPRDDLKYEILEVGSWAGGSTVTFAEAIAKYNNRKGKVVAVDAWRNFHGADHIEKKSHRVMEQALSRGTIFSLFLHNIKSAGYDDVVVPVRGWSSAVLPLVRDARFDLIFVDGSHFYRDVLNDLQEGARILKDGGILCGDDLELQAHEVDRTHAESHRDNDSLKDPKTKTSFHPGVTLAVGEFCGEVSSWKGFWAMLKIRSSDASVGARYAWEKISYEDLDKGNVIIPKHLA